MSSRRGFLKTGLAAAGAFAVTGHSLQAGEESVDEGFAGKGYDYSRPELVPETRLVFIGDSITDMNWGRNEKDRNHYLGHSYVYLIAARLGVDLPNEKFEFFNRGHSGNRLTDLKGRWDKDVIELNPDLVSVLIGVNDRRVKDGKVDLERWEADYRDVLSRSRARNEDLRIVLIDPFVLKTGWWMTKGGEWDISRSQIHAMGEIVATLANDFDAAHVPMQRVFDEAAEACGPEQWIWDGVHPLPQGHELIARHWLANVCQKWN